MEEIILYSNGCPRCKIIEKMLEDKGIRYKKIDKEDVYIDIAKNNNIDMMPFAEINGEILDTKGLQNFIIKG